MGVRRRLALALPLALVAAAPATRPYTDESGAVLKVPVHPARIADLWYAHNALMVMLGAAPRIVMTTDRPEVMPWMFRVAPSLRNAVQLAAPVPGAEALLAARVDLVMASTGSPASRVAAGVGIPAATFEFQDARGLERTVDATADVLNDPEARAQARAYDANLEATVARVLARTAPLPEAKRPRVLHLQSLRPLRADGDGTIVAEWIRVAGGRNAAAGFRGNQKPVSAEQVAAWAPDVIILDTSAGPIDPTADGGIWRSIPAVRDGHVLVNPRGVYTWDRYGAEYPLQVLWVARTLHPDLFADLDMAAETRNFFHRFFRYDLTPDETSRILHGQPPPPDGAGAAH